MPYFAPHDEAWTEVSESPEPPFIEVSSDRPTVHFVGDAETTFDVPGAPARTSAETVHTVAIVDDALTDGLTLCALRAENHDLTVEDRRPSEARTRFADAFDQLQSALDEIMIPVYIDDALDEVSESVEALVAVHTAEYASPPQTNCTYFRTAVFRDGTLLLEAERGSL